MTALLEKVLTKFVMQVALLPDAEQDAVAARLLQTLAQFEQEKQHTGTMPSPKFGSAKGLGDMTSDFEDPITDSED